MSRYFLPHIDRMAGYVPGEQPRDGGFIKLNTNENPYPPSPRVAEAIAGALDDRLRLYPDPVGTAFREVAAELHGVEPGDDPGGQRLGRPADDPHPGLRRARRRRSPTRRRATSSTGPSPRSRAPGRSRSRSRPTGRSTPRGFARPGARLAFIANPNSPSGTVAAARPARRDRRGGSTARWWSTRLTSTSPTATPSAWSPTHPNVIVLRTLSKGYSLAGLRLGYLIARPEIVEGLIKVKDSYNCDTLSLVGGAAALEDRAYLAETRRKILATRAPAGRRRCEAWAIDVPESQANFVWCTGGPPASATYEALKARKILVRLMRYPGHPDGLRITVGTDAEIDRLLDAPRGRSGSRGRRPTGW